MLYRSMGPVLCLVLVSVLLDGTRLRCGAQTLPVGRWGLTASIQRERSDIQLPYWVSKTFTVAPSLSIVHASDVATDWGVGVLLRRNIVREARVIYVGARFALLTLNPDAADSRTDVVIGPAVGGEVFLDDHFSVGVEAQLNIAVSGDDSRRFGNPDGTNVNTASAVNATFYF